MNTEHPQCRFRRKPLYAAVLANFVALGTTACVAGDPENPCAAKNPCAAATQVAAANPCATNNPCNPCAANPCAANPCTTKNPCAATTQVAAANPCATKNPCNPCAANPCAANPCAAKNPCNPCAANPCAAKNPCNPCAANPCAAKNPCNPCAANPCNPCGANPCGAASLDPALINRPEGSALMAGDTNELIEEGKTLWNDTKLSSNGLACETCHSNNQSFLATFAEPYPHAVAMPQAMAGMSEIDLDEMVQLCMVVPMAADPLGWDSRELAALTAYTAEVQKSYMDMVAANPCAAQKAANPCNPCAAANPCNPCAAANPCNPCAGKNPCAATNPCAANPCAAKNPCSG